MRYDGPSKQLSPQELPESIINFLAKFDLYLKELVTKKCKMETYIYNLQPRTEP